MIYLLVWEGSSLVEVLGHIMKDTIEYETAFKGIRIQPAFGARRDRCLVVLFWGGFIASAWSDSCVIECSMLCGSATALPGIYIGGREVFGGNDLNTAASTRQLSAVPFVILSCVL